MEQLAFNGLKMRKDCKTCGSCSKLNKIIETVEELSQFNSLISSNLKKLHLSFEVFADKSSILSISQRTRTFGLNVSYRN